MSGVESLITLCRPGEHFIGLWIVKIKKRGRYFVRWCVSYIDLQNVHAETELHTTAAGALYECMRELEVKE